MYCGKCGGGFQALCGKNESVCASFLKLVLGLEGSLVLSRQLLAEYILGIESGA